MPCSFAGTSPAMRRARRVVSTGTAGTCAAKSRVGRALRIRPHFAHCHHGTHDCIARTVLQHRQYCMRSVPSPASPLSLRCSALHPRARRLCPPSVLRPAPNLDPNQRSLPMKCSGRKLEHEFCEIGHFRTSDMRVWSARQARGLLRCVASALVSPARRLTPVVVDRLVGAARAVTAKVSSAHLTF